MKVVIASLNPVKMAVVKQAFKHSFTDRRIIFDAIDVPSGVSDQPLIILETMEGAINRAQAAASKKYDYSVGIEGVGVHPTQRQRAPN